MLNIISSNIKFNDPSDGCNIWQNRRPILMQIFRDFNVDILCTQEGWMPQVEDIASDLNHLKVISEHRNWIPERMYPNIYIKKSRFQVLDSGDIWLSKTPYTPGSSSFKSCFPRLCIWAILKDKENNQNLFIINTHLDHKSSKTRHKQIQVLINEVEKKVNGLPLIIAGDFNEDPFGLVRKELVSNFSNIIDPWMSLEKNEESSFHKFKGHNDEKKRIDWVLIDKNMGAESIQLDKTKKSKIYPSDHFPVKLRLKT